MVQWVLWWERQERWLGRKRQGPMWKKCILINLWWIYHLCALIISSPMRHTFATLPYPLNRLPHVSPNNMGHLKLKNLSADLFLFSLSIAMVRIWGLVIYRLVYYTPQNVSKLSLQNKQKFFCSCLMTVDQGGQKNRNGKSSNTNFQRIGL